MKLRIKELFVFPHSEEYEIRYNRDLTKSMYKPLLLAVVTVLLLVMSAVCFGIFFPDFFGRSGYVFGLLKIHLTFAFVTLAFLFLSIGLRRRLLTSPALYIALCNAYAGAACLWASVFASYANYSSAMYTAFITVILSVAMVSLYKPLTAVIAFTVNYIAYVSLLMYFLPEIHTESITQIYNAGVVSLLGIIIAIAFYRFRTRTFCDRQTIAEQLEEISSINRQLQQLVHIDNLTGLFNRRYYEEILTEELQNAAHGVCCMMLDIDYFKRYNDHFGHPMGDDCLRTVAKIIQETISSASGTGVRYGGEEFFVFLQTDTPENALELAQLVCKSIEERYIPHPDSPFGKVTISCGMAYVPKGSGLSLHAITKKADEALYQAKESGRARVFFEA